MFLKGSLPSLNLDMSTDANREHSLKSKTVRQTVYVLMRLLVTVSSGSTLFAQISIFVCRSEILSRIDSSTLTLWTSPLPIQGVSGKFLLLSCFEETSELNANSVDPDQTPCSAASDLGLHFLPMSLLFDARLKWVKQIA